MIDPLEVERRFREVVAFCATPISPVRRLILLDRFLGSLGIDAARFESYLLDISAYLHAVARELPLAGHDPEELGPIIERISTLESILQNAASRSAVQQTVQRLRYLQAAAHAFVGDLPAMLSVWSDGSPAVPLPEAEPPFASLQLLRAQADRMGFRTAVSLEQLYREWEEFRGVKTHRALVPVIEHLPGAAGAHEQIGALVSAEFRVSSTTRDGQDDIAANVHDVRPRGETPWLAFVAAQAARAFLAQTFPSAARQYFAGRVTFQPQHLLHEGSSADLAMTALIYAGILQYTNQRVVYRIKPAVAFTGGILPSGGVTPVDPQSLSRKIRAVFFSPAEVLVVPRVQLDAAREATVPLHARYPSRMLEVVGVDSLRDVFSDLRIIQRVEHSHASHTARWFWRRRNFVGIAAVVAVLTLTIALLMSPPIDMHPASVTYEGSMLVVRNRFSAVIDEIAVGQGTAEYMRRKSQGASDGRLHGFVDIDGDGQQDLVYGIWPGAETGTTSHVCARPLRSRSVFWDVAVTDTLHFPGSPESADASFALSSFVIGRADSLSPPSLFLTANNLFFPALVRRLDLRTGATLATYVHAGHIATSLFTTELDEDDEPEILICGINNAYRKSFLAVLDPRFIDGHSPAQGAYVPDSLAPGLEKYYLLIPETVVGAAYHFKRKSSSALRMELRSYERTFFVHLDDVAGVIDDSGRLMNASFYIYFDRFMRAVTVNTGESYDMLAGQLKAEGIIPAIPDKRYFEQYMRGIQYWTGDGWSNTPVINRRYREARERMDREAGRQGTPEASSR